MIEVSSTLVVSADGSGLVIRMDSLWLRASFLVSSLALQHNGQGLLEGVLEAR